MTSWLSRVHSELTLRRLSLLERLVLAAIILSALAMWIRFAQLRVFVGDEVGTLKLLHWRSSALLSQFDRHLTMNYFILAEKYLARLFGAPDWRLSLLPLAGAAAVVPLTAAVALKFTGSTRTSLIAALLVAFNPFLFGYAPVIRSYSLLTACSLLAINEFLHWYRQRDWWSGGRYAAAVLLLMLAHLNGIYTVILLGLLLGLEALSGGWRSSWKFLWDSRTLWIPLAGAAILIGAAYWRIVPDLRKFNQHWTDTPPTSVTYLVQLFTWYTASSGYDILLFFALFSMGVWSAAHEQRPLLLLCAALVLLPLIMSLQGMSHYVHAYARFLISCVPLLFILIAEGIDWLARHLLRQRYAAVAAWGMSALLLYSWTPRIRDNFAATNRWPYRSAANFLHAEMQPKDVIVAEWGTGFNLSQFFDHFDDRIMLPAHYINKAAAKPDARTKGRVFYVTPSTTLEGRTAVIKRFGQMEITIYDGETPRILFEKWRTDLMARTGGRIARELQSDYEVLAVLEAHLQGGRPPEHWELVAARCREQESAARELPPQLVKSLRPELFH